MLQKVTEEQERAREEQPHYGENREVWEGWTMGTRCGTKETFVELLEEGLEQDLNICRSLTAALTPAGANQEPTVCLKPVCCIFPAIITCI